MTGVDNIRNSIIDKLLTITNKEYLSAIYKLISNSASSEDHIQLSEAQIVMLNMSDEDIKNHRVMSQQDLDKADLKWLNGL